MVLYDAHTLSRNAKFHKFFTPNNITTFHYVDKFQSSMAGPPLRDPGSPPDS